MNAKKKREKIAGLFNGKNKIIIENKKYKKLTGENLPQDFYYLLNKSVLSDEASKHSYKLIEVIDKKVVAIREE